MTTEAPPLSFEDAAEVLAKLPEGDMVLVGGQAVSYWADHFRPRCAELAAAWPYTSKDVDFQGARHLVQECARRLDGQAVLPSIDDPPETSGVVLYKDRRGYERRIDFLSGVYGLDTTEVRATSLTVDLVDDSGQLRDIRFRIMHPVLCLESRVHNVVGLPHRYDNPHGRMQL